MEHTAQLDRVFLEPGIVDLFENTGIEKENLLTYFVNELRFLDKAAPYSFVSTLDGIAENGIRINGKGENRGYPGYAILYTRTLAQPG